MEWSQKKENYSLFLCESLAGVFLLSMHAPKQPGWMESGAAESGRGFPGLGGDHRGSSFHASAPVMDAVQSVCHRQSGENVRL